MANVKIRKEWLAVPISCTCEVYEPYGSQKQCGNATTAAYPTLGGGWMSLCEIHAKKHLPHGAYPTDELIRKGGTWV